jgi:hypothetical protein
MAILRLNTGYPHVRLLSWRSYAYASRFSCFRKGSQKNRRANWLLMTLTAFRALLPSQRVELALRQGTRLMHRPWAGQNVHLFYLPTAAKGIFVELSYENALGAILVVNSFTDSAALENYLRHVTLPARFD